MDAQTINGSETLRSAKRSLQKDGSALADEFRLVLADIEDLIRSSTSLSGDEISQLKDKIGDRISAAKDVIAPIGESVIGKARKAVEATNDYVGEEPWKAVGIGAAVGFLLGLLVSRR